MAGVGAGVCSFGGCCFLWSVVGVAFFPPEFGVWQELGQFEACFVPAAVVALEDLCASSSVCASVGPLVGV